MIKKGFPIVGLLLMCAISAMGQNVSEQYCKQIEDSIIKKLNPTKMDRQEVYDDECVFEFTVAEDIDVSLYVEKHDTEEESRESIEKTLVLSAYFYGLEDIKELPFDTLETNNEWDEIYFSKATKGSSSSLWLWKGKIVIRMLSLKDEVLIQMEKLLSDEIGRL